MRRYETLVIITAYFCTVIRCDPCLTASTLQGEIWRSVAYTLNSGADPICDVTLTEGWYRIDSEAGNDTVTDCPPIRRCSTNYPIWMNGSIPDVADGIVSRQMCTVSILGCCSASMTIQVKNCGDYRVYKLVQAPGCPQAYCFGTLLINTTTTTTTTTTKTTTTTTATTTSSTSTSDTKDFHKPKVGDGSHSHDSNATIYIIVIMVLSLIIAGLLAFFILKNKICKKDNGKWAEKRHPPPPYSGKASNNYRPSSRSPIIAFSDVEKSFQTDDTNACVYRI